MSKSKTGSKSKWKRNLLIITAVVIALVMIVGAFNIYAAVVGGKAQVGVAQGYDWSKENLYDTQLTKSIDIKNDDFKILVVTDIHLKNHATFGGFIGVNYILDWAGDGALDKLVKNTAPDLILVLGDSVLTKRNDIETARIVKRMDSYDIPWACVFGNHDDEGRADKNKLVDVLLKSKTGLFTYGPKDMHGAGNYVIELKRGERVEYALFMFDSGSSIESEAKSTGINEKQVDFYNWNMEAFKVKQGEYPKNMSFFHIPLPIFGDIKEFTMGAREEATAAARIDAGLLEQMAPKNGTHVLVGHDHNNNFIAEYLGMKIGYATKSSYNCYFKSGMTGGTLLTIGKDGSVTEEIKYF